MGKEYEGKRFNKGKIRYDLIPPFAQEQFAKILTNGAEKYGDNNWQKGMGWKTVLASLKRHIAAFERGEDFDDESGLLHMAHAMCNTAFILEYYKIFPQGDDRNHKYLKRSKIGLDIDEVLSDWVGHWVSKHNQEVPKSWNFDRDIGAKFKALENDRDISCTSNIKPPPATSADRDWETKQMNS